MRRICLTSPTGTGKTVMLGDLIRYAMVDRVADAMLYTNRKMLLDQTAGVFKKLGFDFGIRAAGHMPDHHKQLQVSSVQTEASRVLRKKTWEHFPAGWVFVDEAHQFLNDTFAKLMNRHLDDGAVIVGVTATPIGMGDLYDELVIAGKTSDGRSCGALVPARHYGCGEPDLRRIGPVKLGEDLSENQNVKAMMVPGIFGRVLEWFERLNPKRLPTILFAPSVQTSIWFAEQFNEAGISAAHVDGDSVWVNGQTFKSNRDARKEIFDGSRDGRLTVLCNRFVLREGIDAPWLQHGIMACVFGSLQSYLQSGGRLLRAYPGKLDATIQDHGGNWWRHGSLNADRNWTLDCTAASVSGTREERLREKTEAEPACCPQCGQILLSFKCPCGFIIDPRKKSRIVIQADGTLREHYGDIFKPRKTKLEADTPELWKRMYFRARNAGMTFRQAEGLFVHEHGYWPPRDLPVMPGSNELFFKRVADVPRHLLKGGPA
jgi:superfamily II DNA or RNA helicase